MSSASRPIRHALLLLAAACLAYCARGSSPVSPSSGSVYPNDPASVGPSGVLVGAGDIGDCATSGADATARLLDRIPGTVFAAGDNAYSTGSREEYRSCYDPTWGRHRSRTRPVPGNHEYVTDVGAYFDYFSGSAGSSGAGYYRYGVGPWSVFALNSEIASGPGSPQLNWLRGELAVSRSACTAVYWHRPLFSSGRHGNNPELRDLWRTLYEFNVDLVINAHDHTYERFAPQDPDGRFDPARGIREFVVGTGGAPLYEFFGVRPNSEARGAAWGVAVFTLHTGGYEWEFVPVEGQSFRDSGSAACH